MWPPTGAPCGQDRMWSLLREIGEWGLSFSPLHSWVLIPGLPLAAWAQVSIFFQLRKEEIQPYQLGSSTWISNKHLKLKRPETELLISAD